MGGSNVDLAQACQDRDEKKEDKSERAPLLRKASYTSSLDSIAIGGEEHEKVNHSCFSKRWVATSTWCKCAKTKERASTRSSSSSKSRAARSRRIRNKRRWRTNWLPRRRKWMEKPPKDWKKSRRPSREDCPG